MAGRSKDAHSTPSPVPSMPDRGRLGSRPAFGAPATRPTPPPLRSRHSRRIDPQPPQLPDASPPVPIPHCSRSTTPGFIIRPATPSPHDRPARALPPNLGHTVPNTARRYTIDANTVMPAAHHQRRLPLAARKRIVPYTSRLRLRIEMASAARRRRVSTVLRRRRRS